jgi:hypothetical protein
MTFHKRLIVRLCLATLAFALVVAVTLLQLARLDQQNEAQAEQRLLAQIQSTEFGPMQDKLEDVFRALYRNVRTITLMPGVQKIRGLGKIPAQDELVASKRFLDESGGTIQQIFNILSTDVRIVKIYASIDGLDYWSSLVPFFTYGKVNNSIKLLPSGSNEADVEDNLTQTINSGEYEYYPAQIDKLKVAYPVFKFTSLDDIPAVSMPVQRSCAPAVAAAACGPQDRDAVLYSLPFYNQKTTTMTGIVSVIVRNSDLESVLLKAPALTTTIDGMNSVKSTGLGLPEKNLALCSGQRGQWCLDHG